MEIRLAKEHQRLAVAASSLLVSTLFNYGSSSVFSALTTVDYSFQLLL